MKVSEYVKKTCQSAKIGGGGSLPRKIFGEFLSFSMFRRDHYFFFIIQLQGDQLYIDVLFWCLVKRD